MLKIRLMRIGAKRRPFYRVVVVDERNKRNGAYVDLIGTYNPLTEPHEIKLDQKKLDEWLKKGAQKSDGLLRILKEAPQRHRKPKKGEPESVKGEEKVETAPAAETSAEQSEEKVDEAVAEAPAEETKTEETPVEDKAESEDSSPEAQTDQPKEEAAA